ncbi:hypothetical protein EV646_12032 [Kribbella antiqua]|uniref:DUF8094 domain-containing protein n=1 Tax=Kribbella antiqua TaxID=2512217 RepID=A0A4R2I429_9ACTN|nr:hypothetical protein [Kribbella antiqua]TCO38657.1 hypothetical protein EV646_12032 [Kribbella antiqua]
MRFARTALGLVLTLAGLVVTFAGAAAAFWLVGPDNTVTTDNQQLTSKGLAVITAPDLLDRHGPILHVTATGDRPVFVGVGQDLDVSDYLAGSAHTRLIRFDMPARFDTQDMRGGDAKLTPPGDLDWWVAQSVGSGKQSVAWPIQDGRYDVVVMNADGTPAVDAQVRFGVEVHRLFGICLLVFGAGILLLTIGLMLTFRRRPAVAPAPVRTPVVHRPPAPQPARPAVIAPPAQPAPIPVVQAAPAIQPVAAREAEVPKLASPINEAPMLMKPADVAKAKAKSPAFLVAVGVADDEPEYDDRPAYDGQSSYDDIPVQEGRASYDETPGDDETSEKDDAEPETVALEESPEFQKSDEAVKKTAALLASGALLLTTTSCGLLPAKNTVSAATPETKPAVTVADAKAVVQRYNQINNQANKARNPKLTETIEGNPTLAQSRAGFVISKATDAAGKDLIKPFTYTNPQIGAPAFSSYPMRFVVTAGVSTAPENIELGVWQRQSAGAPWLLTNSVYPLKTMNVPSMEGLRTPEQADLDKLYSTPASAGANLATYLSGGATSPKATLFTPSPGTTKLLQQRATSKVRDVKESYIASVVDTFKMSGEPLTFITSSGEALVFLSLTEQYLQRVEPGSNAYWTSGDVTAFSKMVKYTQSLYQDYLHQVALVIPTKAAGGKIRVLSIDGQLVGGGGA